jgi:precorrin-2 dehydrogenase/sirohydrochlorin ferrochelatase
MFYPAFLKIGGKKCVVIGGGAVAARKARTLLGAGAEVAVVAPELCPGLEKIAGQGRVKHIARGYRKTDLRGAFIAVAATDDMDVNLRVCRDAEDLSILVNCAAPPDAGNFIVPSASRRGRLTIAVSTGGRSPMLAKLLRRELDEYTAGYAALLDFLEEARASLKNVIPRERDRAAALEEMTARLMEVFRADTKATALKQAKRELKTLLFFHGKEK